MNTRSTYLDNEFRQVFRNINAHDRLTGIDPEKWVKYCKKNGATTAFLDFRTQLYANHDSQYIPKDPALGDRDLGAEFSAACRKHGLKCGAYIPPSQMECLRDGHDDWQQRSADGQLECRNWNSGVAGISWRTIFCYNSGFGKLFADHLREVAQKYKVHAFYIDGVIYGFGACYCQTCKGIFRKETGQEMPTRPDWSSELWHTYIAWRYRQVEAIGRLIGEAVHSVDPKIAVVWNCSYPGTGWYAGQSPAQAKWMDQPCLEMLPSGLWSGMYRNGFSYAEELAWGMSLNRAIRFGQWGHHYTYFTPMIRLPEIAVTANLACAFGAQGCPQEHTNYLGEYLGRIRQVEPWLIDSVSAADVALHYSVAAQNAYYQPDNHGAIEETMFDCRGAYKTLLNAHVPTEVITDEWLETESLDPFRVIILPNSAHLSPKAALAVQRYVRQGGSVIASMETGLRDSLGRRTGDELLWKGSGLRFVADIPTLLGTYITWSDDKPPVFEPDVSSAPDQFLLFKTKSAMKAWLGEDITLGRRPDGPERREINQFAETPSVHVGAKAVTVATDSSSDGAQWKTILPMRYRTDKAQGFLTCPSVLSRKFGKGRIVYVNFQIGLQGLKAGTAWGALMAHPWWRHFLKHLVETAGGPLPVAVEAPLCLKAALWKQPAKGRYMLHLVNELSGVGVQNLQREDVIPVPAKVTIALPGVKKVKVVLGDKGTKIAKKGKAFVVTLPSIQERAVIECS